MLCTSRVVWAGMGWEKKCEGEYTIPSWGAKDANVEPASTSPALARKSSPKAVGELTAENDEGKSKVSMVRRGLSGGTLRCLLWLSRSTMFAIELGQIGWLSWLSSRLIRFMPSMGVITPVTSRSSVTITSSTACGCSATSTAIRSSSSSRTWHSS